MPKSRRKAFAQEIPDAVYSQLIELIGYDAASLRAMALWLNHYEREPEIIKEATRLTRRNCVYVARAVDYFEAWFTRTEKFKSLSADDYLALFEYAKIDNADKAGALMAINGTAIGLRAVRKIVKKYLPQVAKPPSLASQCADFIRGYDENEMDGMEAVECFRSLPAVSRELARRERAAEKAKP